MGKKRSRDWAAYFSSDSDEDGQVLISASIDQSGAVSYTRHPAVNMQCASSDLVNYEAEPVASSSSGSVQPAEEPKPRKQRTETIAEMLLEHSDALRDAILAKEREPRIGHPCACNASQPALYRCNECFARGPLCCNCIVVHHKHIPFHWIEKWDGSQFVKDTLSNLGLIISLGHDSRRCPYAIWGPEPGRLLTIVHTNGMHRMRVVPCNCNSPAIPDAIQFTSAGLFPATMELPRTVFTFQVLKDFEVHNLAAKKTVQKQCVELQRLTREASPSAAPDRSASFIPVARVWRQLTSKDQVIDRGMQPQPQTARSRPEDSRFELQVNEVACKERQ